MATKAWVLDKLELINAAYRSYRSAMATLTGRVGALEARVAALETRLAALEPVPEEPVEPPV